MYLRSFTLAAVLTFSAVATIHAEPVSPEPGFPTARVRVWQMGLLRGDRLQHATFAFTAGLMSGLSSREPIAAAATALSLGLAKEIWDGRNGHFDGLDLLAGATGAAGAAFTTITLKR
jgi:hypothetical protein